MENENDAFLRDIRMSQLVINHNQTRTGKEHLWKILDLSPLQHKLGCILCGIKWVMDDIIVLKEAPDCSARSV